MRVKNLLVLLVLFLQVMPLSSATGERRDVVGIQQETRCVQFKKCFCKCWHHPATRVTVGIGLVALGMLIHVDLVQLLTTNLDDFNRLTTLLPQASNQPQSASAPVEHAAVMASTEEKTASVPSSLTSEHDKDLIIAALLFNHLRPAVREQLHIEPGKPVSADVLAMVQFFIPPANRISDSRGGHRDVARIKGVQGDGTENDPLYLEFAAQMEERARG